MGLEPNRGDGRGRSGLDAHTLAWRTPVAILLRLGAIGLGFLLLAELVAFSASDTPRTTADGLAFAGKLLGLIAGMVVFGALSVHVEVRAETERATASPLSARAWALRIAIATAVVGVLLLFGDGDASVRVNAAAFLVPTAALFVLVPWFQAEGTGDRPGKRWLPVVVMGWMLASFMGASAFATWFDVIPPQPIVACEVYKSHGWKVSATLAGGRGVYLPYGLSDDRCAPPVCPPLGTSVERRRGEGGYRVDGVLQAREGAETFVAITGLGALLCAVGLALRAREQRRGGTHA